MTTVNGKLIGAANPQRVEMVAALVDVTGKPAVGYVATLSGELVRPVPIHPASDGAWTVDLTPNTLIDSQSGDTLWAVQEGRGKDGSPVITYIAVPATGGPYWVGELRADLSTTLTGDSTVVYLAGQKGDKGDQGDPGPAGADGATGTQGPKGDTGDQGPVGPQPPLGAAGAGDTIALKSTDPSTTNARVPTAHAATHEDGGTDELALAITQILGLAAALADKAGLAGAAFTGDVSVAGAFQVDGYTTLAGGQFNGSMAAFGDLTLIGTDKGYRFRRGGDGLDLEGAGKDVIISVWSAGDFSGTQHAYFRLSSDAQNVQLAGPLESVASLYGGAVHKLDPTSGEALLGGKNGLVNICLVGRTATAGAPASGTWAAGDTVQDSTGALWICTAGGTPGTWSTAADGATIRTATARITDGTVPDLSAAASWSIVTSSVGTPLQCSIPAAAGDRIRVSGAFMRQGGHFLDWVLLDSTGAIALYAGSGTSSPLTEGHPALYPSTSFSYVPGDEMFTVASGHINAGAVTVALAHKGSDAMKVYAMAGYPFRLRLENIGAEPS